MLHIVDSTAGHLNRCDNATADTALMRVDLADNAGNLLPPEFHPDGSVTVEARIARPGVYVYRDEDGSVRRELVTADVLHAPESLATLQRVSVTLTHPAEQKVAESNAESVIQGDVGETVTVDADGYIRSKLRVRLPTAVSALRRGVREISPGYALTGFDPTPGVDPVHGAYDGRQLGRIYNHVAIVDRARGGHGCEARIDSETPMNPVLAMLMAACGLTVTDGMKDEAAGKMIADAFQKTKTEAEGAAGKAAAADQEKTAAVADAAAQKVKCDAAEALLAYDGVRAPKADTKDEAARLDALDAFADARAVVRGLAAKAGVDEKDLKGKSIGQARRIVAAKLDTGLRADASDAYVEAFLDVHAKAARDEHPVRAAFTESRADAAADAGRRSVVVDDDAAYTSRMKGLNSASA